MSSGDSLFTFNALAGQPPATNFAALTRRNNHFCLAFDATTSESIDFESTLPRHYAGGGITLTLYWMAATATTGAVVWQTSFERQDASGLDLDADSFATGVNSSAQTVPGTSGALLYTTIAHTNAQLDGLLIGEHFRLRVSRLPADGGDTAAGDIQLLEISGRET